MAWGSKTQIITSQSVSGTEVFSSKVTLNPGESAQVEVEANFPATPTDDLVVAVYPTLDASSEDYDDTPLFSFSISKDKDPNKVSFTISRLYAFCVGVVRSGSTDTITVNAYYRKDGINA